jgi:hypothetical protein
MFQNESEFFKDPDFQKKIEPGAIGPNSINKSLEESNQIKQVNDFSKNASKLSKTNKAQVIIRNFNTHQLFATIEPPYFESISFVKFSPSGRLLLIANENCQYFYVYEILPSTGLRVQGVGGPNNQSIGFMPKDKQELVRLQYYLFRGYSSAMVTDV